MSTEVSNHGKYVPTKRGILSDISKTFDVLGWIAPVILPMKVLFQQLWKLEVKWDDPIPEPLRLCHQTWREELPLLADMALPRCYFLPEAALTLQLHGFSDASKKAFSAVIYIRATYEHSSPTCMLVVAKTRVAPLKPRTIPELELCGATLLAELLATTRTTLNISSEQVTAWCDSTIVLCWLNNCPSRYKTFVGNRITTVTSFLSPSVWHHVPSEENPADCASRGLSARELREHKLWWSGPPWLLMEPIAVPRHPQKSELDQLQTEEAKASTCLAVSSEPALWLAHRYSSYRTLTHVTAWVLRAAYNFLAPIKLHPLNKDSYVTVDEIKSALKFLQKSSQQRTFPSEIKQLTASPPQTLISTSHILSLNLFMVKDGLLHVGSRLSKAPIPFSQKHPVMLSSRDIFIQLIFRDRHITLSHCGPTLL